MARRRWLLRRKGGKGPQNGEIPNYFSKKGEKRENRVVT